MGDHWGWSRRRGRRYRLAEDSEPVRKSAEHAGFQQELERQRSYLEGLELRLLELEERLDFTERLLAQRRQAAGLGG